MSTLSFVFQFLPQKLTFKQLPQENTDIKFNLLYNSKQVDSSEPYIVTTNQKEIDLSSIKPLKFNTKNQTNKYPIIVYVLYGGQTPSKKIILKRSEMMKRFETEGKEEFVYQENFGDFSLGYQTRIHKSSDTDFQVTITQKQSTEQKITTQQPSKPQQSPPRGIKRPSMLQVGQRTERIRKNSADQRQLMESLVNIRVDSNTSPKKSQRQTLENEGASLTQEKVKENEASLEAKDVMGNLFETFGGRKTENAGKQKGQSKIIHKELNLKLKDHQHSPQDAHHPSSKDSHHPSSKDSHQIFLKEHQSHHENHHKTHDSHHDSHHGHGHDNGHSEQSHPLSLKLKTVIVMLIMGFLFLMYDALDDRFSRKINKKQVIVHDVEHHQENVGHETKKNKKVGKKQKKANIH